MSRIKLKKTESVIIHADIRHSPPVPTVVVGLQREGEARMKPTDESNNNYLADKRSA